MSSLVHAKCTNSEARASSAHEANWARGKRRVGCARAPATQTLRAAHPFFQEVFHRLDVVVGDGLDLLDARAVGLGEPVQQVAQKRLRVPGQGRHLLHLLIAVDPA